MNWNISLNRLLSPDHRHYVTVGDCARILAMLLKGAKDYRAKQRWGWYGPTEYLTDHGGCVNCENHVWQSRRRRHFTYDEHRDGLVDTMLNALCVEGDIHQRWRKEQDIHLFRSFKRIIESFGAESEREAWKGFESLHLHRLPQSINPCHRNVKVICFPELVVSGAGVYLRADVTDRYELRTSGSNVKEGSTASRWDVSSLTRRSYPIWNPFREKFDAFVARSVEGIKAATPRAQTKGTK